jgi:hypothetical protein
MQLQFGGLQDSIESDRQSYYTRQTFYSRRRPEQTLLYKLVAEHWETFQCHVNESGKTVPKHVAKEFYEYLDCGILAKGFLRVACEDCRKDKLVAFACRARGFCPSCMGRRQNETAVFLVDHVLPKIPIRQWVLSFPFAIRYLLAKNPKHVTRVLQITNRVISGFYNSQGKTIRRDRKFKVGSVTAIQRFGGSVNLNVHFHGLWPDGVFHGDDRAESFMRTPSPSDNDIKKLVEILANRILSYFKRKGLLDGIDDYVQDDQTEFIDELSAASITSKIATGPRQGQRVRRLGQLVSLAYEPQLTGPQCAYFKGFSLHANTKCEPMERDKLEKLAKYINRPPIANDRLSLTNSGQVLYRMKAPYQDGTTHLVFDPLEFIEKLCALVPQPRMHMIRYAGVFGPNSKDRSSIVKRNKVPRKTKDGTEELRDERLSSRISWAKLLRRVFQIDIAKCNQCGGNSKVVAAVMERQVIVKILDHLGIPSEIPVIHPARAPPQQSFDLH